MVRERQKRWKEKLEGFNGTRLVKQVYVSDVDGRKPRGRPRRRWDVNFIKIGMYGL